MGEIERRKRHERLDYRAIYLSLVLSFYVFILFSKLSLLYVVYNKQNNIYVSNAKD